MEEIDDQVDNLNNLFGTPDQSAGVQAIKELFDKKNVKMKSEVSKKTGESEYFARLCLLGQHLDLPILSQYAEEVLEIRVSSERQGRKEAVQMSKVTTEQEKRGGFLGMFGRR